MKFLFNIIICIIIIPNIYAQEELTLLGTWKDSTIIPTSQYNNPYNEIWGINVNGHEYAILGSTFGTHFIDVTDPSSPEESFVIEGGSTGNKIVHRDFHDHKGFLYSVCQEGNSSTLQIIDCRELPEKVTVVYDSDEILDRTHNIFIDSAKNKLYVLLALSPTLGYASLRILDIEDPTNPIVLASHSKFDNYYVGHVHDAFVKNDTAYLNCGPDGLVIAEFSDPENPNTIVILETGDYEQSGYNHSGWLTDDGKYYVLADETHNKDMKIFDVQNLPEVEVVSTINPGLDKVHIPHNQIIHKNYLYSSYYYDGVQIWDLSDPTNPVLAYYYDTSEIPNTYGYAGCWGVYPFLASGNILVSDMQEGLFVLEGIKSVANATTISNEKINVFPNPATSLININTEDIHEDGTISIYDISGRMIQKNPINTNNTSTIQFSKNMLKGLYNIEIKTPSMSYKSTFIKN